MKKDNVYKAGAQDVILVKYISNVLENKFEDYDSSLTSRPDLGKGC